MADRLEQEQVMVAFINVRSEIKARRAELAALEQSAGEEDQRYHREVVYAARLALSELQRRRLDLLRRLQQRPVATQSGDYVNPLV
ncbi:hypothetical protein [Paraburkholderia youngii]|uniref:hypothetical protein n=1 Tax=Paraburkholderia youngii TaxID=2782701 RepID=UPI003D222490